jgi:predicted RND superfamily exporter protein
MQDNKYNDDQLIKEQNFEQNFSKLDIIGKPLSIGGYCKEQLTGDYHITTQKKRIHRNDMFLVLLFLILIGVLLFWWKFALFKLLLFIFV